MVFTRLVIHIFMDLKAVFIIFASKKEKRCFRWLRFDISGYKEAKNNIY